MDVKLLDFCLGDLECLIIQDQSAVMPLGNLVADAGPEELEQVRRELGLPPEGVAVGYNCLLVRMGELHLLVDAGYGRSLPGREGALLQGLQAAGIDAEHIARIVITHADRDHIGGILDEQGAFVFPNARYVLWQGAWGFWQNEDNVQEWPEEIVTFIRRTIHSLEPRLELVDAGEEFLPGWRIVPAVGHRHDHVVVRISSRGERLWHLADAVIHPLFMDHPGWASTYDSVPARALAAKARLLDRVSSEQALVFASHFPFPGLGRVMPLPNGWAWQPLQASATRVRPGS